MIHHLQPEQAQGTQKDLCIYYLLHSSDQPKFAEILFSVVLFAPLADHSKIQALRVISEVHLFFQFYDLL